MKQQYKLVRYYEKFGKFLQDARKKQGLTQRDVGIDELGYSSAQFISNFERGIVLPPLSKLRVLIKLYKLNVDDVVKRVLTERRGEMSQSLK